MERVKCGSQERHHAATKPDEAACHEMTVNMSTSSAVQRAQLHLQADDHTCGSPSALKILKIEIFLYEENHISKFGRADARYEVIACPSFGVYHYSCDGSRPQHS